MDYIDVINESRPGFNFDLHLRNAMLAEKGLSMGAAKKTGTTICGAIFEGGVVLAADTRATAGDVVAEKNCDKLHPLSDKIWCAGAGTAADLFHTTKMMSQQINMHRMHTNTAPRVCTVVKRLSNHLYRHQGYIGCALVLGGVDIKGPSLHMIYPHGSTSNQCFTTMGSGSLHAMAVMESQYKDKMTREDCIKLCANAITAGVMNDLGSGSNVDVCIITKDKTEHIRPYKVIANRLFRAPDYKFPIGTTPVLKTDIRKLCTVQDGDVE